MSKTQWLLALFAAASIDIGTAQTVNVNLHNSDQGTTHSAGAGVLGSGPIWTRFEHTWGQNNVLTNLKDDHGVETSWTITDESHSALGTGTKQSSPNLVQDVAWGSVNIGAELRFSNLTPNTLYQVAIYNFRMPTVGSPAGFTVNGQNRTGVTTDVPEIALPGQQGYDYVLFLVSSGVAGEIEIVASHGSIAGVQVSPYVPSASTTSAKIRALKQKIRKLSRGSISPAEARKIARLRSFIRHLR